MRFLLFLSILLSLWSCNSLKKTNTDTNRPFKISFLKEKIIPPNVKFNKTIVGGLSSLDYTNNKYYAICDDKNNPRFYELDISINTSDKVKIKKVHYLQVENDVDPEALRFDKTDNTIYWTSEGNIKKNISPAIFKMDTLGRILKKLPTPQMFQAKNGARHNGTFEGLSLSKDSKSLWVVMELPLKQDGNEPQLTDGKYPIRISKIDKNTGQIQFQFAYMLNKIPLDSNPSGKFMVNGVPEILSIDNTHFLVIERAYASGHQNGGNTVKIFFVDSTLASDISSINSLKNTTYIPAKKTLLFDFEKIRSKLTNGIVDNIEGITFGPNLPNGNRTLLVISDDNFQKFSKQIQQIIIFEVIE